MALVLAVLPILVYLALPRGSFRPQTLLAVESAFLAFIPGIALSPTVWQWTGDDRHLAPWGRGLLQFLGLLCLELALILGGLALMGSFKRDQNAFVAGMVVGISIELTLFLLPIGIVMARLEKLGRETQEAKARARDVQWMGHRGSFSPRLLFSNLQHLADLAHQDVRRTEQGLLDLAALYRQGLIEAEHPLVSLATERDLAEQYLDLERPRWKGQLVVRWHLEPERELLPLPPLVLLPLLEAILSPGPQGGRIFLDVNVDQPQLENQSHLRLIFTQSGDSPRPEPAVEEAILHRIQAVCQGGQILGRNLDKGWELELWVPISKENA
jgi:hypothetical protein